MGILQELKQFKLEDESVDEMLMMHASAKMLHQSYIGFGLEPPEWVVDKLSALDREIRIKQRDELERELKKTELALEGLKSAQEKREDLRAKANRLRSRLGGA